MPQPLGTLKLSSTLQQLQSGVLTILAGKTSKVDSTKIMTLYSKGVLAKEGLLNDAALLGLSQQVDSELNNAKTLMNQLGYTDVTKAPALSVNTASLRVVPGQLKVQSIIVKHPIEPILPIHAVDVAPIVAKPVDVAAGRERLWTSACLLCQLRLEWAVSWLGRRHRSRPSRGW